MSAWYCYRTAPGLEERAHNALTEAGVDSLYIHEHVRATRHRHKRVKEEVIKRRPVLIGYVLAQFHHDVLHDYWDSRIRRVTCYGGPQRGHVPAVRAMVGQIVGGWRTLDHLAALADIQPETSAKRVLVAGDAVRATAGPFADQVFVIEAVTKQGAKVRLGTIPMMIPLRQLVAA